MQLQDKSEKERKRKREERESGRGVPSKASLIFADKIFALARSKGFGP